MTTNEISKWQSNSPILPYFALAHKAIARCTNPNYRVLAFASFVVLILQISAVTYTAQYRYLLKIAFETKY